MPHTRPTLPEGAGMYLIILNQLGKKYTPLPPTFPNLPCTPSPAPAHPSLCLANTLSFINHTTPSVYLTLSFINHTTPSMYLTLFFIYHTTPFPSVYNTLSFIISYHTFSFSVLYLVLHISYHTFSFSVLYLVLHYIIPHLFLQCIIPCPSLYHTTPFPSV